MRVLQSTPHVLMLNKNYNKREWEKSVQREWGGGGVRGFLL